MNEQINLWREKRRLANFLGKKSRGRRINRNIKKLAALSKGLEEGNLENYTDSMVRVFLTFKFIRIFSH